ncbi:MAG: GAF domain-containing protein [Anaerolineae bacterium]|nr:GAF domain-containing protein [Anaerolineae bacterium]
MNNNLAERRATLLHAAAKVARNLTSILHPEELLATTVDVICDEFGFYYAGVFMVDETGKWAILCAGRGAAGAKMVAGGHRLQVGGQSMIGAAIAQGKALIALDVGDAPVHFDNPLLPNTRSEMALPLLQANEVIGALTVQSEQEAAFSDDDIMALQMMADQLATAIQNARIYEYYRESLFARERQARLLEAAAEVGHGVTSILDMKELLSKIVDIICDAYGFYFACVYLIDETGGWLVARAARGAAGRQMLEAGHRLKVGGMSMNGTVAIQGRARIAQNVADDPVHFQNPLLSGTQSEVVLPLLVSGQIIGTLTVQSTQLDAFSEDDITSLQTMADQLAIALNNARLLEELKAAHAELVRSKTFEALATSTVEAIHWIGNKALPISTSVMRLRDDMKKVEADADLIASLREDLDMIDANARLIISVQEHLIGPAREHKPQPTMVDDVVGDVLVAMGLAGKAAFSVAPDLPLILADATQLSRAVGYVLQNAVEAVEGISDPRIEVQIAPANEGQFVAIRVIDNGPGIPEGDLDKVWATFYTTKGPGHAGLGLSAALQVIRQLEGQVAIRNVDDGMQVELCVPVIEGMQSKASLPGGKKVLLIDDAGVWRKWAESALTGAGNAVEVAVSAPEEAGFDLILLDDVLAGVKTLHVIRQLRKNGLAGQTVVVASRLRVERTMELMNLGVRDVMAKPYTIGDLAALLG